MYSETPDIIPFPTSLKRELLAPAELDSLKGGTLHLLDRVGVHFPSRRALEILADHGARDLQLNRHYILGNLHLLAPCWRG